MYKDKNILDNNEKELEDLTNIVARNASEDARLIFLALLKINSKMDKIIYELNAIRLKVKY